MHLEACPVIIWDGKRIPNVLSFPWDGNICGRRIFQVGFSQDFYKLFFYRKKKLIVQTVRWFLFISVLSQTSRIFAKKWKIPEIKSSFQTKSYQTCPAMCWNDESGHSRTKSVVWEKGLIWDILYRYRVGWTKSLSYIYMSKLAFIPFLWLWQLLQCLIAEHFTVKLHPLHVLFKRLSWGYVTKIVKLLTVRNNSPWKIQRLNGP